MSHEKYGDSIPLLPRLLPLSTLPLYFRATKPPLQEWWGYWQMIFAGRNRNRDEHQRLAAGAQKIVNGWLHDKDAHPRLRFHELNLKVPT
jgi:hypothetical protein